MSERRRYSLAEMGDLEDAVCRASHAAEMAAVLLEHLSMTTRTDKLSRDENELLYFAVHEAVDYADKARAQFYAL